MSEPYEEYAADWAALEDDWFAEQQRKLARGKVMGFGLLCCDAVREANAAYDKATAALVSARTKAERAQARLMKALDQAEAVGRVLSSGDSAWEMEVAQCLENFTP